MSWSVWLKFSCLHVMFQSVGKGVVEVLGKHLGLWSDEPEVAHTTFSCIPFIKTKTTLSLLPSGKARENGIKLGACGLAKIWEDLLWKRRRIYYERWAPRTANALCPSPIFLVTNNRMTQESISHLCPLNNQPLEMSVNYKYVLILVLDGPQ